MKGFIAAWIFALTVLSHGPVRAATACATCHPAETAQHERTAHAHAMLPALHSPLGENLPSQPLQEGAGGFQFIYRPEKNGIAVTASRGMERAEGIIEWVMGAGVQGETPLIRTPFGLDESRVSYFPQIHQYGITVGHPAGTSSTARAALGMGLGLKPMERCFGCHATGGYTKDLEPIGPGVGCARCHSGAERHAAGHGKPLNPGKLNATAQALFCGNCHRSAVLPSQKNDPENVRFQPYRLMMSQCFATGKLSCITCHPAHHDAVRNDHAFYIAKCVECHSGTSAHADGLEKGDCIGCHMPRVAIHPALKFTDHFIRVVKSSTPAETAQVTVP